MPKESSDLETLRNTWHEISITSKIVGVVGVVMGASSIASLSETVANWKGFILDGIEFYRRWITEPIHEAFTKAGLNAAESIPDLLIVWVWLIVATARRDAYMVNHPDWARRVRKLRRPVYVTASIFYFLIAGSVLFPLIILKAPTVFFAAGLFSTFLIYAVVFSGADYFDRKMDSATEARNGNERSVLYASTLYAFQPFAAALLIVGVLAAINTGLSE